MQRTGGDSDGLRWTANTHLLPSSDRFHFLVRVAVCNSNSFGGEIKTGKRGRGTQTAVQTHTRAHGHTCTHSVGHNAKWRWQRRRAGGCRQRCLSASELDSDLDGFKHLEIVRKIHLERTERWRTGERERGNSAQNGQETS